MCENMIANGSCQTICTGRPVRQIILLARESGRGMRLGRSILDELRDREVRELTLPFATMFTLYSRGEPGAAPLLVKKSGKEGERRTGEAWPDLGSGEVT